MSLGGGATSVALGVVLISAATGVAGAQASPSERLDELLSIRVSAASKLEQSATRAPGSVAVVTAEEIVRYGYRTLGDVLRSVAGFYVTYDRNYLYLGVRGFSRPTDYNNRVLLLVDGFRINEDFYGSAPMGSDLPIDLRAVDRIEIVRGPGSSAFGGAAMLAVVNIILRKADATSGHEVAIEGGSFGALGASVHGAAERANGLGIAWSVSASDVAGGDLYFPEYDDPATQNGITRDTDWERSAGLTVAASFRDLEITVLATSRDKGIPTGAYESDFGDRDAASSDAWLLFGTRWRRELTSQFAVSLRGSGGTYSYSGVYPSEGLRYEDSTDNDWWSGEVVGEWTPSAPHRLVAGVELRRNTRADYCSYDDAGTVYFDGDFPNTIRSFYLEHEFQASKKLLISAGLRRDEHERGGSATNPRVSLVLTPNGRDTLKLIYGEAFRPPNVYETFYEDVDLAKGNPNLEPERVKTMEIEWQRRLAGGLVGSIAVYRSRIEDLLDQELDASDGLLQFRNHETATSRGVEVALSARAGERFSAYASLAQQSTEDADGRRLTNSPARQAKLGLSASLGSSWMGALEGLLESGRETIPGSSTSALTLVDANFQWASERRPISVSLRVRNLLGETYYHPAGFEHVQARLRQDGRSFTLRLGYRF
jgi:outer membrane receptor protein involved in Fe transport